MTLDRIINMGKSQLEPTLNLRLIGALLRPGPNIKRQMDVDTDDSLASDRALSVSCLQHKTHNLMGKIASQTPVDVSTSLHRHIQHTTDVTVTRRSQTTQPYTTHDWCYGYQTVSDHTAIYNTRLMLRLPDGLRPHRHIQHTTDVTATRRSQTTPPYTTHDWCYGYQTVSDHTAIYNTRLMLRLPDGLRPHRHIQHTTDVTATRRSQTTPPYTTHDWCYGYQTVSDHTAIYNTRLMLRLPDGLRPHRHIQHTTDVTATRRSQTTPPYTTHDWCYGYQTVSDHTAIYNTRLMLRLPDGLRPHRHIQHTTDVTATRRSQTTPPYTTHDWCYGYQTVSDHTFGGGRSHGCWSTQLVTCTLIRRSNVGMLTLMTK